MSPVARLSSPDRSAIGPIGAMRSSSLAYLPDGELGGRRERGASESNCCFPANLTSLATFFVQKQCKGLPFVAGKARSCLPFFARLPPGFELWARGLFSRLLCSVSAGGEGGGRRGGGEEEGGEQTEHQARTPSRATTKYPTCILVRSLLGTWYDIRRDGALASARNRWTKKEHGCYCAPRALLYCRAFSGNHALPHTFPL